MTVGMNFKKTSGIRYQVESISETLVICRQLNGAGEGREIVFKKSSVQENIDNKKFKVLA